MSELEINNLNLGQPNETASDEEYLLLNFLKRFVNASNNKNIKTTLSDHQLINMLHKDFNIDIKNKIEFELEVYVSVFRKYLRSWPYWDLLDGLIKEAKSKRQDINSILQCECPKLKEYLVEAFKVAENHMKPYVTSLKEKMASAFEEQAKSAGVAMEVKCSKAQLNVLIFNKPNSEQGHTIFNVVPGAAPSKISLQPLSLKHILNWSQFQVKLFLPYMECVRRNENSVVRNIINIKTVDSSERKKLSHKLDTENVYYRESQPGTQKLSQEDAIGYLEKLLTFGDYLMRSADWKLFDVVVQEFLADIRRGPRDVSGGDIKFFLHKFKYVRYSSVDVPEQASVGEDSDDTIQIDSNKYDLWLEEILTPSQMFTISPTVPFPSRFDSDFTKLSNHFSNIWVKFECCICKKSFDDNAIVNALVQHFYDSHGNEGDWQCSGCKQTFRHNYLIENRWYHDCN